jgi:hypothetical protein
MSKFFACAASFFLAAPAFAGACIVLDYQEMKEMPTEELVSEACTAREALSESLSESIDNIGRRREAQANPSSQDNFDQCSGQIARIDRVLIGKGLTKGLINSTCRIQVSERKTVIQGLLKNSPASN